MILVGKSNLEDFHKELECMSNDMPNYVPVGEMRVTSTYCPIDNYTEYRYSQRFVKYAK